MNEPPQQQDLQFFPLLMSDDFVWKTAALVAFFHQYGIAMQLTMQGAAPIFDKSPFQVADGFMENMVKHLNEKFEKEQALQSKQKEKSH